jgi:hypothetical protein
VTQELLNRSEVCSIAEEVSGIGVAEGMGVNGRVAEHKYRIELYQPPDLPVTKAFAFAVEE